MPRGGPRDWMWSEALQMLSQAERLHRQVFKPHASQQRGVNWEPPVDVLETEPVGHIIHRLELPQGRFERQVQLPPGRYGPVRSISSNGCLVIHLGKISGRRGTP